MFSIGQALSEVTPLLDVESLSASYPELQSRGEGGGMYVRQELREVQAS